MKTTVGVKKNLERKSTKLLSTVRDKKTTNNFTTFLMINFILFKYNQMRLSNLLTFYLFTHNKTHNNTHNDTHTVTHTQS